MGRPPRFRQYRGARGPPARRTRGAGAAARAAPPSARDHARPAAEAAAPLLPFLPLLPKQILLNNFLSDLPMMAVAADRVDEEHGERPQRWDVAEVRRFMLAFGLLSSLFDLLAFGLLLWVMRADEAGFQTGWFLLSLWTAIAVVLVLRTARPAWRRRPATLLLASSAAVALAATAVPYLGGLWALFGFVPVGAGGMLAIVALVVAYVAANEAAKRWFWRRVTPAAPAAGRRA